MSAPTPARRPRLFTFALITLLVVAGLPACKDRNAAAAESDGSGAKPSKSGAHGPVIDGEHFTTRTVIDHQQGNMTVGVFIAPEKWRDSSEVKWIYANNSNPVTYGMSAENPANAEAVFGYPAWLFFSLRPDSNYYKPLQNFGGLLFAHQPQPAPQTLLEFVRRQRGNLPGFKVVGTKELPELAAALKLPPAKNQRGLGLKISYDLNGAPVEEEFYTVYSSVEIPYDGPQGRTYQINWGLMGLHSFRAPAGTLEKRRPVFAAVAKSFRINPAWEKRRDAVFAYLVAEFNRQLKAGYDSIAAAAAMSKQISANNDAMIASIDKQLQASHTTSSSGGSSGAATRSSTDNFDDYLRGVETVDDPYYGTSQHSINEQYHWTDGYGSYRNSNDATYDPNHHEVGDWQLMPATR